MVPWLRLAIAGLASGAGLLWAARGREARAASEALAGLERRARMPQRQPPGAWDLAGLPAPVRRYLNRVLPAGRRSLQLVRYEQAGMLRGGMGDGRWMPFTATQVTAPESMEFIWSARVAMAPLLHLQVTDGLVRGIGSGKVALLSAVPVASAVGGMQMNSGALHRFLAEAVWYPTALLPSAALSWAPIDDRRALATLSNGRSTVSLEFRFNADDEVIGIYTPGRWRSLGGRYELAAWEGKFRSYRRHQGVLVPTEGEVGWYSRDEWRPVWRGTVVAASLRFRRAARNPHESSEAIRT